MNSNSNRLASSRSPYLLQHADNPVHWQPWDQAAFEQAVAEDKPVLLSIGYAACHWCHVMERESFTDTEIAAQMNALFVNIKVDREERPDIDRIYQAAHYLFTRRSGGWPLTMFLTPTGEPFFGGTYFPKEERPGLTSFSTVMTRVAHAWRNNREAIRQQNEKVLAVLRSMDECTPVAAVGNAPTEAALNAFNQLFDRVNGGLGDAPKFPHPMELAFCLENATARQDSDLTALIRLSLKKMAAGGLNDHLGGGFYRYCVDAGWNVPHFEKMLSDNGLLIALFADADAVFADAELQQAAMMAGDWALTVMRAADGCFYSSLDADSPGGEGAFYAWDKAEIKATLSPPEYAAFASHYGLEAGPNHGDKWHLVRRQTVAQTAAANDLTDNHCRRLLDAARVKLERRRRQRQMPATDDKILTAWNALMIRGLARGGRKWQRDDWQAAAREAFTALCHSMRTDGQTRAARRGNDVGCEGFLDDCAFLLDAALELLRHDFSADVLATANTLAEELCTRFEDEDNGGFFFTAHDGEALIRRIKSADDNAIPNGNGVAVGALLTLSWLTGDLRWQQAAEKTLRAFAKLLHSHPTGAATLLGAWRRFLSPPPFVFLTGEIEKCRVWQQKLEAKFPPDLPVYCLPPDHRGLPPALQKKAPTSGVLAYICGGFSCQPPLADFTEVTESLRRLNAQIAAEQ